MYDELKENVQPWISVNVTDNELGGKLASIVLTAETFEVNSLVRLRYMSKISRPFCEHAVPAGTPIGAKSRATQEKIGLVADNANRGRFELSAELR